MNFAGARSVSLRGTTRLVAGLWRNKTIFKPKNKLLVLLNLIIIANMADIVESAGSVKQGNAAFASSLYRELRKSQPTNFVSSPVSLSITMAMLKPGTDGVSAEEIVNVMKFPGDDKVLLEGMGTLMSSLEKLDDAVLTMANKIYVHHRFALKKEFSEGLETQLGAQIGQIDFSKAGQAASAINSWASEKTRGKITELLDASMFDDDTRIVLANAVYFKDMWLHPFPSERTVKDEFFVSEFKTVQADMMKQTGSFKFAFLDELDSLALLLPFKTSNLSMLILLPNELNGIQSLEDKLVDGNILQYCSKLKNTKVDVTLPRFKLESTLNMKKLLQSMGLTTIFSYETAKLGGIFQTVVPNLEVSEVIQKAVIEVNEEGAEAAAATAAVVRRARSAQLNPEFIANHPFVFAILHSEAAHGVEDSSILFYGSIVNPAESVSSANKDEL